MTMNITMISRTIGIPPNMFPTGPRAKTKKKKTAKSRSEYWRKLFLMTKRLPIRILDVGAGYGALTQFLLSHFSKRHRRLPGRLRRDGRNSAGSVWPHLTGRFDYVLCDFTRPGWTQKLTGPFEAVVSAIAIHNVGSPKIIERIYGDIFPLVKIGGCFINFDREWPPLEDQMKWLRDAGFQDVKRFWTGETRALFGGFKR